MGDELTLSKNTRAWGYIRHPKLHKDMHKREDVHHGSPEGDHHAHPQVHGEAIILGGYSGQQKVERVQKQGAYTGDQEYVVPFPHDIASRIEDLAPPRGRMPIV